MKINHLKYDLSNQITDFFSKKISINLDKNCVFLRLAIFINVQTHNLWEKSEIYIQTLIEIVITISKFGKDFLPSTLCKSVF